MLDIKFIRENKDLIKDSIERRGTKVDLDELLKLDDKRKKLIQSTDEKKSKQNEVSKEISTTTSYNNRELLVVEMRKLKSSIQEEEADLKEILTKWRDIMLTIPNIPDMSVPTGKSDEENREERKWGDIPEFGFEPRSHIELMEKHKMIDMERGVKVAGFRGYFLKGDGAKLSLAIHRFVLDEILKKEFELFIAPSMVRPENFWATGHFPKGKDDIYKTQDDLYLAGTAEVPMIGYHSDEILDIKELPKKYIAFSQCFRREAGSHGKDTKGLMRVHEFTKLEQFILCEAEHGKSVEIHEEITKNAEEILQKLGIPHRIMTCSTGDMSQGAVKTYDIESWVPSEDAYRETHSSSYYHDFQARRAGTKYKNTDGKTLYVHSLNNTAIATPRILISIVENNQREDGSILIPEVLRPYIGKDIIS